jgi:hypothetical protein
VSDRRRLIERVGALPSLALSRLDELVALPSETLKAIRLRRRGRMSDERTPTPGVATVREALRTRGGGPLILLDLAVPRSRGQRRRSSSAP